MLDLRFSLALLALLPLPAGAAPSPRAAQWLADVGAIADDANEGRATGSPGHLRAADHVERRFREIGLAPAGEHGGFRQQVALEEQRIDYARSRAELADGRGKTVPIALGSDMLIAAWAGPRPARVDAPLIFLGYGLHLPEQGHDDFAGVDLKGKIAVVIGGGPARIAGPIKASNRSDRSRLLAAAGAVGVITLTPPRQIEIPWERQKLLARQGDMYLADSALRTVPDDFFLASVDPAAAEMLFAGSGHSFAELAAASDASAAVPTFALPVRFKATIAAERRQLVSPNLVARLDGADPVLRDEHVVVSAHLDHVGIGPAIGDAIYNGAIDDGSGVATVLDIAGRIAAGTRPKRSMLFLIVTAEEPGLLGSTYFARKPTVPARGLVADLNFDVLLPLWPLTSILAQGDGESSLGDQARDVAARHGLTLVPDPLPNRNSFVRTDQYSFVRVGIPALAFKFGFTPGTEAFRLEGEWRATRYHAPNDDIDQPGLQPEEMVRFDDYAAEVAIAVANAPSRPRWLDGSVFKHFAPAH
ncbi:M28 family peptidase [Sphingomonas sp. C8-2]|jgi:hypothetical protein|nr:M28 family peptidase [Sphingomonas sp. C8-2]